MPTLYRQGLVSSSRFSSAGGFDAAALFEVGAGTVAVTEAVAVAVVVVTGIGIGTGTEIVIGAVIGAGAVFGVEVELAVAELAAAVGPCYPFYLSRN